MKIVITKYTNRIYFKKETIFRPLGPLEYSSQMMVAGSWRASLTHISKMNCKFCGKKGNVLKNIHLIKQINPLSLFIVSCQEDHGPQAILSVFFLDVPAGCLHHLGTASYPREHKLRTKREATAGDLEQLP